LNSGFSPGQRIGLERASRDVSTALHSPARGSDAGQLHRPANGPVPVKANGSGQQAARLARRDRVVLEHLPLVKAIAVRVHENLPVHVDLDDLVHAGILGLFDAANKFNPEKQVVFSSYAKHRVKAAMLDSVRQLDWASRDMHRRQKPTLVCAAEQLANAIERKVIRSKWPDR
jgi:hypothetical protein